MSEGRGDDFGAGQAHDALSLAYLVLARYEDALSHTRAAIDIYVGLGSPEAEGYVANVRAMALVGLGRLDEGIQALEQGLANPRGDDNPRLEGFVLFNLAVLHRRRGDRPAATRHAALAVDALARLGQAAEGPAAAALLRALRAAADGDRRSEAEALLDCAEGSVLCADLHSPADVAQDAQRLAGDIGSAELSERAAAVLNRLAARRDPGAVP